ncbi:Sec7 domain containing protein [Trichuris trichiura]|uniref:Sec7 domain containing protein n=1 Tax=Trichuris trichiura TaxID=36087 RepID=A0A077Z298_TRITR|nr:Sec7 domain containing protein [Trichuris trichiura]
MVALAKTDSSSVTATDSGERQRLASAVQSNGHEVGWTSSAMYNEARRKRSYRVAVNLFNKNPERGLQFLIDWGFVTPTPTCVARFLITRKGLSKQKIGDYVGNIQDEFCSSVLKSIAQEIDMYTLDLDIALRRFLHHFRLPGEAQKIERVIQAFAERYCQCNPAGAGSSQKRIDTVFVLAFAIIMLNTDLHSPNVKPQKRMKLEDFIKNLRGLDEGRMINPASLADIYERIKAQEFRTGSDHVTQVLKVDRKIVGNKPTLTLPHRRLICYIRLTEVLDPRRKQSPTAHQREAFLFNDLLLLTKIVPKKKNKATYQYRESHALGGMEVGHFSTPVYPYGVRIRLGGEDRTLHFNASCAEDRRRFLEDLDEAILENGEMEALESNLRLLDEEVKQSRQKSQSSNENRDSGVPDDTISQGGSQKCGISTSSGELRHFESPVRESMRKTTSNSSVDSGLAVSASSMSTSWPLATHLHRTTC